MTKKKDVIIMTSKKRRYHLNTKEKDVILKYHQNNIKIQQKDVPFSDIREITKQSFCKTIINL